MATYQRLSLMDALAQYLQSLPGQEQRDGKQELNRFVQWCGRDRAVDELSPPEVAEYAGSSGMWGSDSAKKLKLVKSFLAHLKNRGLTSVSLAPHLRVSKAKKGSQRIYSKYATDQAELSAEGYANLQSRLQMLKEERIKIVADIQRAMADKDFRENAPLDAAKERQGFIESSFRELEAILANAVVRGTTKGVKDKRVRTGRRVTLRDTTTGKKIRYTLVDPREADPVTGKISNLSPVGKALLDRSIGEEVQVTAPIGTFHYLIEKVEG